MRNKIVQMICLPILYCLVGFLLLSLVYCLPNTGRVYLHVAESSVDLLRHGNGASMHFQGANLDNWTDADCLSIAYNRSSNNPFFNALNAYQIGSDEEMAEFGGIYALDYIFSDKNETYYGDHSYLWHGYRIWLIPLLVFGNLRFIRSAMFLLVNVCFICIALLFYRVKNNFFSFIPFALSCLIGHFLVECASMMYFVDIFVMMLAVIAIILSKLYKKDEYIFYIFTLSGFGVAFFSMFMMPVITFAFPLAVLFSLEREKIIIEKIYTTFRLGIVWGTSYLITMVSKWIISRFILNSSKLDRRFNRYTGKEEGMVFLERMQKPLKVLQELFDECSPEFIVYCLLLFVLLVILIYRILKHRCIDSFSIIPDIILFAIPFVWIYLFAGHAFHPWTKWNFCISLYVLLQCVWDKLFLPLKDVQQLTM